MKKLIPFLFLLAAPCWAGFSGYSYQSVINISSTNVSNILGTVNNFPVLVSTNDPSLSTTTGSGGRLNSTGMDLIFSTMSDCSFLLHWDTETVQNVGVSTFNAWVNVPVLSTATATAATVYLCYGNASVTTYQGNSVLTWDSNFAGVWHLANGVSLNATDSTVNQLAGTIVGSTASTNGIIDGDASFVHTNKDHIGYGNIFNFQNVTVEAWYYQNSNTDCSMMAKQDGSFGPVFDLDRPLSDTFRFYVNGNVGGNIIHSNTMPSNKTWYRVVATWNQSTGTDNIYVNGVVDATPITTGSTLPLASVPFNIGYDSSTNTSMDGFLDEVRVSSSVRNSDWIKTDYNNQNSPTTFAPVGPETTPSNPTVTPSNLFLINGPVRMRGVKVTIQ